MHKKGEGGKGEESGQKETGPNEGERKWPKGRGKKVAKKYPSRFVENEMGTQ